MMVDKPTYEQLEQQVEDLKNALLDGRLENSQNSSLSAQRPDDYLEYLEFLSRTAEELFDIDPEQDIYQVIGTRLKEICGNAIVIINFYDKETRLFQVKFLKGLGEFTETIMGLLKKDPSGMTFELNDPRAMKILMTGKLTQGPFDLYDLAFKSLPKIICTTIEKLLNIGRIYVMGFVRHGELFGDIVIICRKGENQEIIARKKGLIETFINQAAIALQRKQFEVESKESEDKYREIVKYAPAGIYEFDLKKSAFVSVNDVMCQYTGFSESEFLELNPFDILDQESRSTFTDLMEEVSADHPGELAVEHKLKGKDKTELWVLTTVRFFFEDGVPRRAMSVVHDLTEIRKAAEEKKKLEEKLHQAHKMEAIGTLAGGIAHDFNNILTGILGYCDLLLQSKNDPQETKDRIGKIRQGATRAAELVRQILTFSRHTEYKKQPQVLKPIAKEVLNLIRSSIPVTIEIREEISSASKVLIDPAKIHQVIMNLCTNAYHAMSDTGGILSVTIKDIMLSQLQALELQIPSGKYVSLEVSDTGHGMSPDILEKIFDPYFTTKEMGKGTGMGLSVVYGIVSEHKGVIKARSDVGKGSDFTVYLPVTEKNIQKESDAVEAAWTEIQGEESIMIVDDEKSILDSTKELLKDYGYQVIGFKDGQKALEAFKVNPGEFDLVLTDMTMPGITGDVLAEEILKIRPGFPIILCTGYNEKMSREKAEEAGIKKFLQKPVVKQPLAEIIREVLDDRI